MKFGKQLRTAMKEAWEHGYVDYAMLKNKVKDLKALLTQDTQPVEACSKSFFEAVTGELEKVNDFVLDWSSKVRGMMDGLSRRVSYFKSRVSPLESTAFSIHHGMVECARVVVDLDEYVNLNRTAFRKAVKKFDKALGAANLDKFMRDLDEEQLMRAFDAESLLTDMKKIEDEFMGVVSSKLPSVKMDRLQEVLRMRISTDVYSAVNKALASGQDKIALSEEVVSRQVSAGLQTAPHGYKGRLIVVEGLDGSGKSTQLDLLRTSLEDKGFNVLLSRWNDSSLLSHTIRRMKRAREMTPITFAMMQATDLSQACISTVVPALMQGKIVLCDRYVYTGLARDGVRGMSRHWLRSLYSFAPKPDIVLYFKVPVDVAIRRVVKRRVALASGTDDGVDSEDDFGSDDEERPALMEAAEGKSAEPQVRVHTFFPLVCE